MRRLKLLIAVSMLLTFTLSEAMAQQGNYRLGEVLGLRYFTVTKGDLDTYEKTIKEVTYPFYDRNMPDADWVLMKGDRGKRSGEYAFFWNITTLERRNFYWPGHGGGPWPNFDPITERWNAEVGQDRFSDFEFDGVTAGDYVLIGAEDVQDMPWVSVLGIHHIEVKAGQEEAFDKFVTEKWNANRHRPGLWLLFYKVDRGETAGDYILVYAFEPGLVRDAYFPGGETTTTEAEQGFGPIEDLWEEMTRYLDIGPGGESDWTDWVIVR